MNAGPRKRFGEIAVELGLVTASEVRKALEKQKGLRDQGIPRPVGLLLVEQGALRPTDVRTVLGKQGLVVTRCPSCRTGFIIQKSFWSGDRQCQKCRVPLVLPEDVEESDLDQVPSPPLEAAGPPAGDPSLRPAEAAVPPAAEPPLKPEEPEDIPPGTLVGGCEILQRIGRGGMGTVYRARHVALNKTVALKVLSSSMTSSRQIDRFLREARSAAKLEHTNIVGVMNVGKDGDRHYIVMQFIEGRTLTEILEDKGSFDPVEMLHLARQVGRGLAVAHKRNIIHRDIKPSNIMLDDEGTVKVADFGLAKEIDDDSGLSRAGQVVGSPHYMSPEQAEGLRLDHRTDIYSLGVTLYHCLSGQRPFTAETPLGVLIKHIKQNPPPLYHVRPDLPKTVCRLVEKMMAKHADQRYADAELMIQDMEKILEKLTGEETPALEPAAGAGWNPGKLVLGGVLAAGVAAAVLALLAGLGVLELSPTREPGPDPVAQADALLGKSPPDYAGALRLLADALEEAPDGAGAARLRERALAVRRDRDRAEEALLADARREAERKLTEGDFPGAVAGFRSSLAALTGPALTRGLDYLDELYGRRIDTLDDPKASWGALLAKAEEAARRLVPPVPAQGFARVRKSFTEIKRAHPAAAERVDLRLSQLGLAREREAREHLDRSFEKARALEGEGKLPQAAQLLREDFLRYYADTDAAALAVEEVGRLNARAAERKLPDDWEEAVAQAKRFAAENPSDPAAVLAHMLRLRDRAPAGVWNDQWSSLVARLSAETEKKAEALLADARKRADGLEKDGKFLEALDVFENFPRPYLTDRTRPEVEAEKSRIRNVILDDIRSPLGRLGTTPESVAQAVKAFGALRRRYAGTTWEKEVDRRVAEVESEARAIFTQMKKDAEQLFLSGEVDAALRLIESPTGFGIPAIDRECRDLARTWRIAGAVEEVKGLIRKGKYGEAAVRGRKTLGTLPRRSPTAVLLDRLLAHAECLASGMVHVEGGAAVLGGKTQSFNPFYIDRFEVSNAQFKAFMTAGGYEEEKYWPGPEADRVRRALVKTGPWPRHWKGGAPPSGREFHPVHNVTWYEARAWALWKGRRLPTELEWNVAAGWDAGRGRMRRFPYGDNYDPQAAYTDRAPPHPLTVQVNSYPAGRSFYGLHHTAGNVFEWVEDWFDPGRRLFKLRKGGDSADVLPREMTAVAFRSPASPHIPKAGTGFRTAAGAPSLRALRLK
jgi:hypothetical protein